MGASFRRHQLSWKRREGVWVLQQLSLEFSRMCLGSSFGHTKFRLASVCALHLYGLFQKAARPRWPCLILRNLPRRRQSLVPRGNGSSSEGQMGRKKDGQLSGSLQQKTREEIRPIYGCSSVHFELSERCKAGLLLKMYIVNTNPMSFWLICWCPQCRCECDSHHEGFRVTYWHSGGRSP